MTTASQKHTSPRALARALTRGLHAIGIVLAFALIGAWTAIVAPRRSSLASLDSVLALEAVGTPLRATIGASIAAIVGIAILLRWRALANARMCTLMGGLAFLEVAASFASSIGHHASILISAFIAAIAGALLLPMRHRIVVLADRHIAALLWLVVAIVYFVYAFHRFAWFGAGSWDLGCMVHHAYRTSRFLGTPSTVLGGEVADHFMVGLYLYAPLFWIDSSARAVLALHSIHLAATAPAVFLVARSRGASAPASTAIALATAFAFGMQSAVYFDAHEITFGFGFFAFALHAIERGRFVRATLLLVLFMLFKESLGTYVVGLGLLLLWRGLRNADARATRFGASWVALGVVGFVIVNRVILPWFVTLGEPPGGHETFADFGPTVFEAALGMLTHPLKTIGALFVPAEKLASHAVTLGGFGWLAVFAPEILIPALPLVAERFLSSKPMMWEMGYHYAAPLALYGGWAVAIGWPTVLRAFTLVLSRLEPQPLALAPRANTVALLHLVIACVAMNQLGYRHAANFHTWTADYFSTPERRRVNDEMIAFARALGPDAKIAAQNRLLPHVADRAHIYRIGDFEKTDYVLLSFGESAWPYDGNRPAQLARRLHRSGEWTLIFSAESAAVFSRTATNTSPAVAPSKELAKILNVLPSAAHTCETRGPTAAS